MSSASAPLVSPAAIDVLVLREQATALMKAMQVTLPANVFIGLSAVGLTWSWLPHPALILWAFALVVVNLARFGYVRQAERQELTVETPAAVLHASFVGALASGLLWAGFLLIVLAADTVFHPALNFIICGITAGATIQGTTHHTSVWAFVIPIGIMHFFDLVWEGSLAGGILATNVALYIFMLCRASALSERSFVSAIRIKHEATSLAAAEVQARETATAALRQLRYVAEHDPLTDLANRSAFGAAFERELEEAAAGSSHVVLMLVDLDRFKAINDTYGHAAGDTVLIEVANRLRRALTADDIIGRIGGDEFAVVLCGERPDGSERSIAATLLDELSRPIPYGSRQLQIGASIGYAQYPRDAAGAEELQICADVALYAAKSEGRRTFRAFDAELREVANTRRILELDLRDALDAGAIEVHFQPQMVLGEHRITGFAARLRWDHPDHGQVPACEIFAAAAATRQTDTLIDHLVEAACRAALSLHRAGRGEITVSFNISPGEFGRLPLQQLVTAKLDAFGVPPTCLGLEISESTMAADERAGEQLRALADLGVKIAIADFGAGHFAFAPLSALGLDCLRLSRTFVEAAPASSEHRALVQASVAVARSLGASVLAEGVETAEEAALLASLGCRYIEGSYVGDAIAASELMQWLAAREAPAIQPPKIIQRATGA